MGCEQLGLDTCITKPTARMKEIVSSAKLRKDTWIRNPVPDETSMLPFAESLVGIGFRMV